MTRLLLRGLAHLPGPLLVRLGLALAVLSLVPLAAAIDAAVALVWALHRRRVVTAEIAFCPAGHPIQLQAAWSCPCGMTWTGSGLEPCPACGATSLLACPCGRTLLPAIPPTRR